MKKLDIVPFAHYTIHITVKEETMATSSIKKSFVVSGKKSALEIANQLIDVEKTVTPTLNRPRISQPVEAKYVFSYLAKS